MRFQRKWGSIGATCSLKDAVVASLEDTDGGSVESAARTAQNAADAFATLVEMLHETRVLSDAQAKSFIGYAFEEVAS